MLACGNITGCIFWWAGNSMLVLQWASLAVLTLLLLLVMADCAFRRNLSTSHTYTTPPYDDAETYV